jgi:hypothetical protein
MTFDELLQIIQRGELKCNYATYDALSGNPGLQFDTTVDIQPAIAEALQQHKAYGAWLWLLVKINDTQVCMDPKGHRETWWPLLDDEGTPIIVDKGSGMVCAECERIRDTTSPRPYKEGGKPGDIQQV